MRLGDDATRFSDFYRENYSLILATCVRRLGDQAAAEDAAAEVFRVAWQRYDGTTELTLPWLYGVARNIVGNEYRRSSRAKALVDRIGEQPTCLTGDEGLEVRQAMSILRKADREILFMAYWEDLSAPEIAEILGITVSAVWVRLSRARDAFRRAHGPGRAPKGRDRRG